MDFFLLAWDNYFRSGFIRLMVFGTDCKQNLLSHDSTLLDTHTHDDIQSFSITVLIMSWISGTNMVKLLFWLQEINNKFKAYGYGV